MSDSTWIVRITNLTDDEGCVCVTLESDLAARRRDNSIPEVPANCSIQQNFPNPFNPTTSIVFELTVAGLTSLSIHSILGDQVATIVHGNMEAGRHTVSFDATNLPTGVYICCLQANGVRAARKMLLIR